MAWANDDLVLYHGTDDGQGAAFAHGLDLSRCRAATDFGRGFYTTTSEHQAKQWANATRERNLPQNPGVRAVVLSFKVPRDTLAHLESLVFVVDNPDYWSLVNYCRGGSSPHDRRVPPQRSAEYDVVYGPVALWRQQLVIKDCDQVSFHTVAALNQLPSPTLHLT